MAPLDPFSTDMARHRTNARAGLAEHPVSATDSNDCLCPAQSPTSARSRTEHRIRAHHDESLTTPGLVARTLVLDSNTLPKPFRTFARETNLHPDMVHAP